MAELNIQQKDLAEVLGVPLHRVKSLTSGRVQKLTREEGDALVKKLNVRAGYLLDGQEPMFQGEGDQEYRQTESQDQFISRMQAINATGRIVDALPLPEREREGLKLCLTGDPVQDGRAIAEALQGASLAQGSESALTSIHDQDQIQYARGTVVPMPTSENAGLTQQEVMTLVLDALYEAKRTLPAARIFAVVDAVMAWQRAGMNVTESSVMEQLRQVK
ncbi:MAG: hypothetical protein J0L85_13750 [Zoogloea sp.]|nr:hypothetical protein [Zoogloea sp.]MCA0188600.1 hypothetical protein [Pseudomonadota bacterium]